MEIKKDHNGLLDLMSRPGFTVTDNRIAQANAAAQSLQLLPGTDIRSLLCTGGEEYSSFTGGCLYLKLDLYGQSCGACVTRIEGVDVFLLDQESDDEALRALSLAARELREPLSTMLVTLDRLSPALASAQEEAGSHVSHLNRSIHQLLRILGNMSDGVRPTESVRLTVQNLTEILREFFGKAEALTAKAGLTLDFQGPEQPVFTLCHREMLERALLNILSNAMKYTPAGGRIHCRAAQHGQMLHLQITDSGPSPSLPADLFHRYSRPNGIEDSRCGLGLGMVMIRRAAAAHAGTVLVDQPESGGTRVTLTLALRQNACSLRSPVMQVDYTGERDHALVELSEILPLGLYEKS